jgi:nicotinamide riboside transporter PnuC
MKIQEFLAAYEESSAKASELTRNFAFAGIAVVWVLKTGQNAGGVIFSQELLLPLYCFVAALAADALQYVYKTLLWGGMNWYYWKKREDPEFDVKVSGWVNAPTHSLFWAKVVLVGVGFVRLLFYINQQLGDFSVAA